VDEILEYLKLIDLDNDGCINIIELDIFL